MSAESLPGERSLTVAGARGKVPGRNDLDGIREQQTALKASCEEGMDGAGGAWVPTCFCGGFPQWSQAKREKGTM